jgi:PAS domain S-box-containing protein
VDIDIKTLSFLAGLTNVIKVLAILFQYLTNKRMPGVLWWVWSFIFLALGHFFLIVRENTPILHTLNYTANTLYVLGAISLYIGIMRFLGMREKRGLLIALFAVFFSFTVYFTYAQDSFVARAQVMSITFAVLAFLMVQALLVQKNRSIRPSAYLNAALLLMIGVFFAVRAVSFQVSAPVINAYTDTGVQVATFMVPFTTGLLLTVGLIIMVSQRLLGESIENKERFEHIFNTSPDAITVSRIADGCFVNVNDGVTLLTGYTRAELIGNRSEDLNLWQNPDDLQMLRTTLRENRFCENMEAVFRRKNGRFVAGLVSAKIITINSLPHIITLVHDITDRKRVAQVLQDAHDTLEMQVAVRTHELHESLFQAEVANRAKSLFIGNMSHELRTPLSGVLGMAEALLNTPVTGQQRDYAETIRKSGKALLVVVSNILDFSKLSDGRMTLESAPFLMEKVIANVVNLFGPSAAEEKIALHTAMDSGIPVLRGDAYRLTQVVNNLVGNAVKFTKAGEIRVTVKILRRTEAEIDLAIDVQDTGIGMTEEELSRVFTGFTQGDTSTARHFEGTGLGLTISRNLVELMGGTLQVESIFGKGSLFTVLLTFPIAQEFARTAFPALPINPEATPINLVTPARPEVPPGDFAELMPLLDDLRKALASDEPLPCKEMMTTLLKKSWPEEQEILLLEVNRLVRSYRLQEALDLLSDGKKASDRPLINMLT